MTSGSSITTAHRLQWLGLLPVSYLRLRERGLMAGERRPSSSVMLSELKCLVRKCSSSGVGWKGS